MVRTLGARVVGSATALIVAMLVMAGCSAGLGGGDAGGSADAPVVVQPESGAADEGRSVVVTGTMAVRVEDVAEAARSAAEIADQAGGRIEGRVESGGDEEGAATLTLRVPAEDIDASVDRLRDLGDVDSVTISTEDVTTAVEDVDARLAAVRSTLDRLVGFQERASTVDELLAVEEAIVERQAEVEELAARQAALAERVAFATLTLELRAISGAGFAVPDSFGSGFVAGWEALAATAGALLVGAGVILPWILVLGALALGIVLVVRFAGRRRRRRSTATEAAAQAAPPQS